MIRLPIRVLCVVASLLFVSGCYQRDVAPEVTYDQSQVDLLDEELQKVDWEL